MEHIYVIGIILINLAIFGLAFLYCAKREKNKEDK